MITEKLYDHKKFESEAQSLWENEKIHHFSECSKKEVFSIDTPPPTVSGTLHIGHIFSYTHADVIARYKRMKGYNVFYPMGFDDNGLPTERYVEKKNSTKAHLMKRSEFIALCLKETHDIEKLFENLWRSIGLSVDWNKVYSTISPKAQRISQYSFIELYKKNLIYRKEEPSLYCTTCRTSVSQAELDSAELSSNFNDIKFTTEDGQSYIIATTRPELLPACVAVFFHPDDTRYQHLAGKFMITPIFEKSVIIMPDDKVDPAKGTGLVMCCTFGDQNDIFWQKKHKLPFVQAVGLDGKWTNITGPLAGLTVHEARKKILELLKESGALQLQKSIVHNVNVHERCKQEIEYMTLTQWFINILDHKEKFLELADKITWKPAFMQARYRDWVTNLSWDWCISRQRFFGIPFPAWHCNDCKAVILPELKDLPIDPQEQAYPGKNCPTCNSSNLKPDTDVMDTWNTSALTPQINTCWPDKSPDGLTLPMSMRPQAHDIIRTWAFDTIVKAYYHENTIPWENIVISGHVLAGKEKISKSKENSKMTPESLLQTFPADAIRFWASNGKLGTDTVFSENELKIGHKLITKLWNAFKFCSEHLEGYQPVTRRPEEERSSISRGMPELDDLSKWVLDQLSKTYQTYQEHFDQFEYQSALETIEKFFWNTFCDNYLELVKDQFFNPDKYSQETISGTRFVLYETGFAILQMYAPVMPHITETLYQNLYKTTEKTVSVHITNFDQARYTYNYQQSTILINTVLDIVSAVRKLKSEKQLSLKTELQKLIVHTSDTNLLKQLATQEALISGITKALTLEFTSNELEQNNLEGQEGAFVARVKLS